jgi:uncharacterized protein
MKTLMDWLAEVTTRYPKRVVVLVCLLTAVAGVGASRVMVTFQMKVFYDYPGNKDVEELNRYNAEFGDDGGFAVVVIETKDVFTAPVLRYIQQISRKLKRKPQFRRIMSLALNTIPRGHGDEVITGRLFDHVPTDRVTLERLRKTALSSRLVVPRLVSRDGRYALVAAENQKASGAITAEEAAEANAAVREVLDSTPVPAGVRVILGGSKVAEEEAPKVMSRDQSIFLPAGILLIILVMFLSFGSWQGVLLAFAEVIVTVVWTFGFMGFMGFSINIMSSSTATILMVYGLLDSVFVMAVFYKLYEEEQGAGPEYVNEALKKTIRRMGPVCLLTSVSTAIGFASFAVGSLPLVRTYGIGLAFGVLVAFFSSVVWMPALISLLPAPKKDRMRKSPITRLFAAGLTGLGRFNRRFRWVIIVGGVAIFAASAVTFFTQAKISTVVLKELPQDMEGIEGINLVADHLLGAFSTGVTVTGKPGSMKDPKLMKILNQLDEWAEKKKIVKTSLSPSDLIRDMHKAFNGGSPEFDKIPDDRGLISQYLALLDPSTRADFLTDDYATTHLRIMVKETPTDQWRAELFEPLQKKAKALLGGYHVEFPGFMRAYDGGSTLAVNQLLFGFVSAFLVIAIMLGIAFRSLRLSLLSLLPNLLPTAIAMAVMVGMGTTLRATTVMFLSIAVGITFDNTIHLFAGMRERRGLGLSHDQAMKETLAEIGPPIIFTSLLIAAGLGIFMLSSIPCLFALGLTSATVVLLAAFSDLLLTTTLMDKWGVRLLCPKGAPAPAPSAGAGDDEPSGS